MNKMKLPNEVINEQQKANQHFQRALSGDREAMEEAYNLLMSGDLVNGAAKLKDRLVEIGKLKA